MKYETVIGLEVHAELATATKIYCGCPNEFGGDTNTHCCPICAAMPGTLPVLNKKVVEYGIKAGLATNCEITRFGWQERKSYFYPDLPKAYQTSQQELPLCVSGWVEIETEDGTKKKVRLNRIHIEEDAGKLIHDAAGGGTLIDYNRGGVPLIEIVTEPDIRSAEEAKQFLENLKAILEYTEVSDCKMQEGSLRCDVNISIRPFGQEEYGTRTEMKNINSFRGAYRAIEYEVKRQTLELEMGNKIVQETRRWDDEKGVSTSMRSKEEAHDYRYFPEPDLMPIVVSEEQIEAIRKTLPELPAARRERYLKEHGLPAYDAGQITASLALANFFDACVQSGAPAKAASNWLLGDVSRILNEQGMEPADIPFTPVHLAQLIGLIDKNTISNTAGKTVLKELFDNPRSPEEIVKEKGLAQISDESALQAIVEQVLSENPKSVEDYRAGKKQAIGFLVGQTMKATKGKGNPQLLSQLIQKALEQNS